MLKKVVLGTVFVVFIGVLITGAVIRTMDKSDQISAEARSGEGNGRNAFLGNTSVSESQGNGQGKGRSEEVSNDAVTQRRGKGGNGGAGPELLAEEESDHLWDVNSGVVTEVAEDILTIETSAGDLIIVEGRAWSFVQEQGYSIQRRDLVQLEGFDEDGEFKVSVLENLTTGERIVLRDTSGRPSWAGGRGGNL